MKKPQIKQRLTSGNRVEIHVIEIAPKVFDAECQWAHFPPSPGDVLEYKRLVVPRYFQLLRRLQAEKN